MTEATWTDRRPGTVELRVRIVRSPDVTETVRIVTDEALVPRGVYAAVQSPDGWRTLEALPKAEGGWLAVVVSGPDGTRHRRDLDLPRDVVVDYPSAAVLRLAQGRIGLKDGEARLVAVLRITPPALDAAAATRRYARQPEPR